jgi:hypothetical protein
MYSCGDKIEDFSGFIKPELEYLLSEDQSKNWIRTSFQIDGQPVEGGCYDSLIFQFTKIEGKVDTSGLVLIKQKTGCDSSSFCLANPEICISNASYCEAKPTICGTFEAGYFYSGVWYIEDPTTKNGNVHEILFKNLNDTLVYSVNLITSVHLELVSETDSGIFFEKFEAE